MDNVLILVLGISLFLIIAGLDAIATSSRRQSLVAEQDYFLIHFPNGHSARALLAPKEASANELIRQLGNISTAPVIFITGGAGQMSAEDRQRTQEIIESIIRYADKHHIIIVDGGTESGIMEMIGETRRKHKFQLKLIGVAPHGKVDYPGYVNPHSEATLEDNHTHFVLVEGDNWGDESALLTELARAICGYGACKALGILINGGAIAQQDVLLATTHTSHPIPMLVLEGSGRFADELATAFKTGETSKDILRAIIDGGDIELISTIEGPEGMQAKLAQRFHTVSS